MLRRYPPPGSKSFGLSEAATAALEGTFTGDYAKAWERAMGGEGYMAVRETLTRRFPAAFPPEHYSEEAFRAALAVVQSAGVRLPLKRRGGGGGGGARGGVVAGGESTSSSTKSTTSTTKWGAALVPVAHLLPHDPRGSEPCVTADADGTLTVRAARRTQGEELGCHRGAATALDDDDDHNNPRGGEVMTGEEESEEEEGSGRRGLLLRLSRSCTWDPCPWVP